jgi:hypothetical protein
VILLALTDIHSKIALLKSIAADIEAADAVLIAGDITHFGGSGELVTVLDEVKKYGRPVYGVCGNCDRPEAIIALAQSGAGIDRKAAVVGGMTVVGIGGSLPAPGGTPNEFSEADYKRFLGLEPFASLAPGSFILVSHQPPANTAVDKVWIGTHVGSSEIRSFIETKKPLLCITGHIHEALGLDTIGYTRIVNPGPLKSGNYAMIEIEGAKVKGIELKRG